MRYMNDSLFFELAEEIVSMANMDFRNVEWMVGSADWGNKSFLGIDNGKIYWQYTAEVRFAFGFLEPYFLIYWGAQRTRSAAIMSDADLKILLYYDELAELGEKQFAFKMQNYILQVCKRKYPNYEIIAQCQYEDILRCDKDSQYNIDGELEPVFEEHFCCDIWVTVKKIRSESSSSY